MGITKGDETTLNSKYRGSGMIDNAFGLSFGKIMPPIFHSWFSRRTGWMFAAVWIRDEQRHKWMWVNQERYYAGKLMQPRPTKVE